MELTVLGCGDAFGNGERFNTSFLVVHDDEHVLLDCGTTTLLRLKEEGINLEEISTIVISHFHGDHFGGIPFFLICSLFEHPRSNPLTIVGPKDVKEKVFALQEIMYPGTAEKLDGLQLKFIEFEDGSPLHIEDKVIDAFQMEHSPESIPHGYKLTWHGKTIAFSGDTSMNENLIKLADHADLFICECNFMEGVNFGHLSYEEIKRLKDQLNCKQLWLSHMNDEVASSDSIDLNRFRTGMKIKI